MINSPHIVIIPDIHGRSFWRSYVRSINPEQHYLFLGDYLDPYDDDNIAWEDAYNGLRVAIETKKTHPDNVTLLYGNHDLHYLLNGLNGTRKNIYKAELIRETFEENADCFRMAEETVMAGKRILFTHAGVHRSWAYHHEDLFGPLEKINADILNSQMFSPEFVKALAEISLWRGGWDYVGSMIWEDARAFGTETAVLPGLIQVFGHTMQGDYPLVSHGGQIACVDCQKVFLLSEKEGKVILEDQPFALRSYTLDIGLS